MARRSVVLVVEHQADCPPALLGEWLEEAGCALSVCRPYAGDAVPGDLTAYDGLLVLGGSMGAGDDLDHPWLPGVRQLIRSAADDSVPTLGVCLGHQLAAVALGGTSQRNPVGHHVGLVPVAWEPVASADPLVGALTGARRAAHWNVDLVSGLPDGALVLARTPEGGVQAVRFAPAVWGVQWHPEIDHRIFEEWAAGDREECERLGIDAVALTAEIEAAADELVDSWRPLASAFAGLLAVKVASGR
ncbi:Glutamine amidotransferase class-I [metagenome]|uniref:Glutamine amidotransferase class-I n=1 Tax=metagenome TaxID=256318 RepID=A0A2P2C716_9ZZZZ